MKTETDRFLSVKYEYSHLFFASMKYASKKKYDFIFSFDRLKSKSIEKYLAFMEKLFEDLSNISYHFKGNIEFSEWLVKHKFYSHDRLAYQSFDKAVFKYRTTSLKIYESFLFKAIKIRDEFNKIV